MFNQPIEQEKKRLDGRCSKFKKIDGRIFFHSVIYIPSMMMMMLTDCSNHHNSRYMFVCMSGFRWNDNFVSYSGSNSLNFFFLLLFWLEFSFIHSSLLNQSFSMRIFNRPTDKYIVVVVIVVCFTFFFYDDHDLIK